MENTYENGGARSQEQSNFVLLSIVFIFLFFFKQ